MTARKKQVTIRLPTELAGKTAKIKQQYFSDCSYSEMYRCLIRLGLEIQNAQPPKKQG